MRVSLASSPLCYKKNGMELDENNRIQGFPGCGRTLDGKFLLFSRSVMLHDAKAR